MKRLSLRKMAWPESQSWKSQDWEPDPSLVPNQELCTARALLLPSLTAQAFQPGGPFLKGQDTAPGH